MADLDAMGKLWSIVWALGWWLLISLVMSLWEWVRRWRRYLAGKNAEQPATEFDGSREIE
jgi:hypothetical protein